MIFCLHVLGVFVVVRLGIRGGVQDVEVCVVEDMFHIHPDVDMLVLT